VVLVLLDFSKAFDAVDHDLLCHKLERFFDFSASAIMSYLTERFHCVSAGGVLPGFLPVLRGVLQGWVLGPFLSTVFINDFCRNVQSSQYHVYANDFQFYAADDISNISLCLERVNSDLDTIYRWSVDQLISFSMARKHRL
jgi:hypothetical protein